MLGFRAGVHFARRGKPVALACEHGMAWHGMHRQRPPQQNIHSAAVTAVSPAVTQFLQLTPPVAGQLLFLSPMT